MTACSSTLQRSSAGSTFLQSACMWRLAIVPPKELPIQPNTGAGTEALPALPQALAASLADAVRHPALLLPTALWVACMLRFLPWDRGSVPAFRAVALQLLQLRHADACKPTSRYTSMSGVSFVHDALSGQGCLPWVQRGLEAG